MSSYYYNVLCYKHEKLQWVVEMSDLPDVAAFLIASEKNRTKQNAECQIKIEKEFVSDAGKRVILDQFNADGVEDLNRIALEVSSWRA